MSKICTSIAQSKKLIELGLNIDTADMYYFQQIDSYYFPPDREWYCGPFVRGIKENNDFNPKYDVASWSLSTLLDIIPIMFNNAPSIIKYEDYYCVVYSDIVLRNGNNQWQNGKTAIEAAYNMVCWLLENKKL